jgi:hypothetical protein
MKRGSKLALSVLASAGLLGLQLSATASAEEHEHGGARPALRGPAPGRVVDGRGQVLDGRYNHGQFYPAFGASFRALPVGSRPYYFRGSPFYFSAGVWYAPGPGGFVVVRPPFGLVVSVLPPYYSTVWIGGSPYYYADNVYYTWDPAANGYTVVAPPDGADQPSAAPAQAAPQTDLIVYPKNGQSSDQQAADRYDCHNWAKGQTGFDPTQTGGGVAPGTAAQARSNYDRAMSACLQARGYQVN